ncbi:PAS domain-containing sensor histidine kinase [Arenimonas daejeonensis]|uniref:PAS domain-containing sensor histidine kinase n=1 Tax=Arenimonas daejeonensis TaxID=370777 RepID=UPI001D147807|nr:PAS domain-containing sensor histidine kinase [Arenimonas daejeonensis]
MLDVATGAAVPGAKGGVAVGGLPLATLLERVHEDDRAAVEQALSRAFADGQFEAEFREITPAGGARRVSASGEVEFDGQNRPRRIRVIARKANEGHTAAEGFRSLFESAPLAIMLVNREGRITLANDLVAAIFNRSRASLEGSLLETLVPERHRHDHAALRSAFASRTTTLMGSGRELFGLRGDGSEVPIEVGLKQVEFADGVYTLATVTDISARKKAEAEATQQLDELAHLSRVTMIGELSGSLAHELNQPLAAILSNAQAAQRILTNDPTDTKDLQDILADIVDDDRRAGEVIRRMRTLLKKGHIDHTPVEINTLVTDVLRLIRSDMIHRGVEIGAELMPDIPSISADPIQLQQVMVNLIFNACDAMEGRDPPRDVRVRTLETPEGAIRVSVEDDGPGIPPHMLQRIFEPFETTKPQGMGLGLAVCRSILDAHGGRIWAENAVGGGARVSFEISRPGSRT